MISVQEDASLFGLTLSVLTCVLNVRALPGQAQMVLRDADVLCLMLELPQHTGTDLMRAHSDSVSMSSQAAKRHEDL